MDTTDILFICGGAFDGLEKVIRGRTEKTSIGFDADVRSKNQKGLGILFREVEPIDLTKFGIIPELVGRLPVVATLDELDETALIEILTEPKNALVKQYETLFQLDGVSLEIRASALKAIAATAVKRRTGARGLRSILEASLMKTMYEIPDVPNLAKVVVEENVILDESEPILIYEDKGRVGKERLVKIKGK